jgi:hypothetical protein
VSRLLPLCGHAIGHHPFLVVLNRRAHAAWHALLRIIESSLPGFGRLNRNSTNRMFPTAHSTDLGQARSAGSNLPWILAGFGTDFGRHETQQVVRVQATYPIQGADQRKIRPTSFT